jgi:hypothetical protein
LELGRPTAVKEKFSRILIQPSGTLPPASPRKGYESWIKSMFADLQPLA